MIGRWRGDIFGGERRRPGRLIVPALLHLGLGYLSDLLFFYIRLVIVSC